MENPIKEGNYTTIFKDGSIVLENPWLIKADGKGKWYWDEDIRGGVIHWFKPTVKYEEHKYYKLPDWELEELIIHAEQYCAMEQFHAVDKKFLDAYLMTQGFPSYKAMAKQQMKTYYDGYKIT